MALTKPPVLPPWAEAGDKVQPTNAEIQTGWPLSNTPPARQRWNWILNFLANGVRYLTRRGLSDYGADETYMVGDRVIGDDGKTYRSIQDNNINHAPSVSPLWWERWGFGAAELSTELNKLDYKASCRVATTDNLAALSGLLNIDGVVLVTGDRVLVKDQAAGSQNGIYVAAAGAWARAADADDGAKLNSGAIVPVEAGSVNADTLWMLTTENPISVGATALIFQWSGGLNAPTQAQFDNSRKVVNSAFVQRALGSFSGVSVLSGATALTAGDVGKNIILSGSSAFATTLPATAGLPNGAAISIENNASADCTVVRAGADTIAPNASSAISSISIPAGTQITFVKVNAVWYAFGSGAASYQSSFANYIAGPGSTGYQKLPGGLIIQWGGGITTPANNVAVNVTLPIAWPNALLSGVANPAGLAANAGVFGLQATGGTSKTQISITQSGTSPQGTFFIAIGY